MSQCHLIMSSPIHLILPALSILLVNMSTLNNSKMSYLSSRTTLLIVIIIQHLTRVYPGTLLTRGLPQHSLQLYSCLDWWSTLASTSTLFLTSGLPQQSITFIPQINYLIINNSDTLNPLAYHSSGHQLQLAHHGTSFSPIVALLSLALVALSCPSWHLFLALILLPLQHFLAHHGTFFSPTTVWHLILAIRGTILTLCGTLFSPFMALLSLAHCGTSFLPIVTRLSLFFLLPLWHFLAHHGISFSPTVALSPSLLGWAISMSPSLSGWALLLNFTICDNFNFAHLATFSHPSGISFTHLAIFSHPYGTLSHPSWAFFLQIY